MHAPDDIMCHLSLSCYSHKPAECAHHMSVQARSPAIRALACRCILTASVVMAMVYFDHHFVRCDLHSPVFLSTAAVSIFSLFLLRCYHWLYFLSITLSHSCASRGHSMLRLSHSPKSPALFLCLPAITLTVPEFNGPRCHLAAIQDGRSLPSSRGVCSQNQAGRCVCENGGAAYSACPVVRGAKW